MISLLFWDFHKVFIIYHRFSIYILPFELTVVGRMLPVWNLIVPTVLYNVLKYLFSKAVKNITSDILVLQQKQEQESRVSLKGQKDRSDNEGHDIKATAQIVSLVVSEMVFFPLETILHRFGTILLFPIYATLSYDLVITVVL